MPPMSSLLSALSLRWRKSLKTAKQKANHQPAQMTNHEPKQEQQRQEQEQEQEQEKDVPEHLEQKDTVKNDGDSKERVAIVFSGPVTVTTAASATGTAPDDVSETEPPEALDALVAAPEASASAAAVAEAAASADAQKNNAESSLSGSRASAAADANAPAPIYATSYPASSASPFTAPPQEQEQEQRENEQQKEKKKADASTAAAAVGACTFASAASLMNGIVSSSLSTTAASAAGQSESSMELSATSNQQSGTARAMYSRNSSSSTSIPEDIKPNRTLSPPSIPRPHEQSEPQRQQTQQQRNTQTPAVEQQLLPPPQKLAAPQQHQGARRGSRSSVDSNSIIAESHVIDRTHQKYAFVFHMLTGIRLSVSRAEAKEDRDLLPDDYKARHKLNSDLTGAELQPSQRYDFKFKDYCPLPFRSLRRSFGLRAPDYLNSLTGKYILSELSSPGKSRSYLYFSHDYRYIVKTIHRAEKSRLLSILPEYVDYACKNPNTLLARYYGLHRMKTPNSRTPVHFVVMANVFPASMDMHMTFDLKGSLAGREVSPAELERKGRRVVLKDLNWLKMKDRRLWLGPAKARAFVEQLEQDVLFLMARNIMDYSMLVGIHDETIGNFSGLPESPSQNHNQQQQIRQSIKSDATPKSTASNTSNATSFTIASQAATVSSSNTADLPDSVTAVEQGLSHRLSSQNTNLIVLPAQYQNPNPLSPIQEYLTPQDGNEELKKQTDHTTLPTQQQQQQHLQALSDPTPALLQPPPQTTASNETGGGGAVQHAHASRSPVSIFHVDFGGIRATDSLDRSLPEIYFVSIIDILTPYDTKKTLEHAFKSITMRNAEISAVPPTEYGRRFAQFMKNLVGQAPADPQQAPQLPHFETPFLPSSSSTAPSPSSNTDPEAASGGGDSRKASVIRKSSLRPDSAPVMRARLSRTSILRSLQKLRQE